MSANPGASRPVSVRRVLAVVLVLLIVTVSVAAGTWTNGFSFLSEHDGYVVQTPISWYSQKGIRGVSPGFGPERLSGRLVSGGL